MYLMLLAVLTSSLFASSDFKPKKDGSQRYVGKCALHEDYEGKKRGFHVSKVLFPKANFYNMEPDLVSEKIGTIDPALLAAAIPLLQGATVENFDDLAIDVITYKNVDYVRMNIGVGGGNGVFLAFLKEGADDYKLVLHTEDQEVVQCSIER